MFIIWYDNMKKQKHAGGRPPKYTEAETMEYKINKYFESCFVPARDRNGKFLRDEKRENYKDTSKTIYYIWARRCTWYEQTITIEL